MNFSLYKGVMPTALALFSVAGPLGGAPLVSNDMLNVASMGDLGNGIESLISKSITLSGGSGNTTINTEGNGLFTSGSPSAYPNLPDNVALTLQVGVQTFGVSSFLFVSIQDALKTNQLLKIENLSFSITNLDFVGGEELIGIKPLELDAIPGALTGGVNPFEDSTPMIIPASGVLLDTNEITIVATTVNVGGSTAATPVAFFELVTRPVTPVPEPATYMLLGSTLLLGASRKQAARSTIDR